jgi:type VI secretion system lysozyme-related protein
MRPADSGLQPPLFERLAAGDDCVYDRAALATSVRTELQRLLNTRRAIRPPGTALTILDYGIGDWTALQAQRIDDRRVLTRDIRSAITHFEPRLQLGEVDIQPSSEHPQRLEIRLSGLLRQGNQQWPAVFVIDNLNGTLEVRHE